MSKFSLHRVSSDICAAALAIALAACGGDTDRAPAADGMMADPVVAAALNDPLMVDPDLAYRNEANSAVSVRYDHALPPLFATDELATRALDAARVELLRDGPIIDLPRAQTGAGTPDLSKIRYAEDLVKAVGGPVECAARLEESLIWAARMPDASAIMPHGMARQAAGVDDANCTLRVVRYVTPVGVEDALQYHFNRADRARMRPEFYSGPENAIVGKNREQALVVHARLTSGGMTAVDLIYWRQ